MLLQLLAEAKEEFARLVPSKLDTLLPILELPKIDSVSLFSLLLWRCVKITNPNGQRKEHKKEVLYNAKKSRLMLIQLEPQRALTCLMVVRERI